MSESSLTINLGLLLFLAPLATTFPNSEARAANPISCDYLFGKGNGGKSDLTFKLDATASPKVDLGNRCSPKTAADFNTALGKAQQACVNSMILWQRHQANSQGAVLPAEVAGCPSPESQLAAKQITSLVSDGTSVGGYLSTMNNGGYYALNSHEVEGDLNTQIGALKTLIADHQSTDHDDRCAAFEDHAKAAVAELTAANARLTSIRGQSAVPKGADLSKTGNFWKNYDSQYGEAGMTDTQANSYANKLESSSDPLKKLVGKMIQEAQNLADPNQKKVADQLQLAVMTCQPDTSTPIVNDGVVAKRTITRIRSLIEKDPGAYGKCLKDIGASDVPEGASGGTKTMLGSAPSGPSDAPPVTLAQLGPNAISLSADGKTATCSLKSRGMTRFTEIPTATIQSTYGGKCPATQEEADKAVQAAAKAKFGDGFVSIGPNHHSNEGDLITCQVKNLHSNVVGPETHPESTLIKWYPGAGGKCPPLNASTSSTAVAATPPTSAAVAASDVQPQTAVTAPAAQRPIPAAPVAPVAGSPATSAQAPASTSHNSSLGATDDQWQKAQAKYDLSSDLQKQNPGAGFDDISRDGKTVVCLQMNETGHLQNVPYSVANLPSGWNCPVDTVQSTAAQAALAAVKNSAANQAAEDAKEVAANAALKAKFGDGFRGYRQPTYSIAGPVPAPPPPALDPSVDLTALHGNYGSNASGMSKDGLTIFCDVSSTSGASPTQKPFKLLDILSRPNKKCPDQ
jgi:hypothetical protein